ncbi:MAG: ABC transporter ATP-binding protein [Acholeplasmataceae bacterium]
MRVLRLYSLAKGFLVLFISAIALTVLHQYTYSNVPLFTQYLIKVLGAGTVNEVNLPGFLIKFFESGLAIGVMNAVFRIAGALLVLQVFRFFMRFIEMVVKGNLREKVAEKLRNRLYRHIQDLSYEFHNKSDSGDLIQRVTTDVETTSSFVTDRTIDVVYLLVTLFFGAYQLININPTMVWATLSILPLIGAASVIYFRKVEKLFKKVEEDESEMMTVIQENLSGSRVVRAFANEAFEVEKMEEKNVKHATSSKKANKVVAVYWGIMDFISINQYLVIIAIGVYYVRRGEMDAAAIIASLALVGMLIWPIRGLGRLINDFGKALVASDRIHEILDQKSEYLNDGNLTPDIYGNIEFKNVSFKFNDTNEHLLKNISFSIKRGETVALIGRTGSGKSTIVNLLMRMYDYQEGDIFVDGNRLLDIQKQHLRKNLGVVLQEPFLFSKTVYDNIAISNKRADRNEIYRAAETAALAKDIKTFQQGYDTLVGEKGTTLSGGQKQRVAIARILIADMPILIFDDALSAVDTQTDLMIRDALKNKDNRQTTIIITHRITTAKEADKIIILNEGQIEAIGIHQELSEKPGLYQKLWKIQGRLEREFEEMMKAGGDNE